MINSNYKPNNSWGKPNPTVKREPYGSLFLFVSVRQHNVYSVCTQCVLSVYIASTYTYITAYPHNHPHGTIGVRSAYDRNTSPAASS